MSARKSGAGTQRSKRISRDESYQVYCVNFYDKGLDGLRDEFVRRVQDGLRLSMFCIDLESEIQAAKQYNDLNKRMSKPKKPDQLPDDPIEMALLRISECLVEYDSVIKQIEAEDKFDLTKYWLKNLPADLKDGVERGNVTNKMGKSGSQTKRGSVKTAKGARPKGPAEDSLSRITCMHVVAKQHHKVGKGNPLNKRMFIKDQPSYSKITILIIGNTYNMDNEFYLRFIKLNLPLYGIIHFLPEGCAYDQLVPRPRREKYLQETVEKIQKDIHSLRKRVLTKSLGIFQQQLPQMSMCLAAKYSDDIFNQLSWFFYDAQSLREQYNDYYIKPYHEIDVKMSPTANLNASFYMMESLSIQGHYLKSQIPASYNDMCTVYLYMESLMNTFGNPRELMTEFEVLLLANPSPAIHTKVLDKIKVYANAFKSILKLTKNERLFVEEANTLLHNIIAYMDHTFMRNIYHACLEYNLLRRYFISGYIRDSLACHRFNGDLEPSFLPKFAKLYLTDDAVIQRIIELVDEYEEYTVEEVYPSIRLYTFKRALHEVFEYQKEIVIPTRLCFRDFTLYEMEQFLRDLVTPQMFIDHNEAGLATDLLLSQATVGSEHEPMQFRMKDGQEFSIDLSMFMRPDSLKARHLTEMQSAPPNLAYSSSDHAHPLRSTRCRSQGDSLHPNYAQKNGAADSSRFNYIGLGADHPMLLGYNLDDARQTIKVNSSRYFFEEGLISLYEEKWNFMQMNKSLAIEISKQKLHFANVLNDGDSVAPNVRLETEHGVSLRVSALSTECARAVLAYPNGLNVFCHDTHTEQLWTLQEIILDERRRVCTPHGCVIVYYNNSDMILIMRHNGEVYRLYNYLEAEIEGEEEEDTVEFTNACPKNSTFSSYKDDQDPTVDNKRKSRPHGRRRNNSQTQRSSGGETTELPSQLRRNTSSMGNKTNKPRSRQPRNSQAAALLASIEFELQFLKFIAALYSINYLHLKLTTSLGSVVNVQKNGKVYCGRPFLNTEWHDYYANESYAMRDDGVRMIWNPKGLKCYHSDGTIITSTTVPGWDPGVGGDDLDEHITQSSSHDGRHKRKSSKSQSVISQPSEAPTVYINAPGGTPFNMINDHASNATLPTPYRSHRISDEPIVVEHKKSEEKVMSDFLVGEMEEGQWYDLSFETYLPDSYLIQHKIYAGIYFNFSNKNDVDSKLRTEIFAADDLCIRIYQIPLYQFTVEQPSMNDLQDMKHMSTVKQVSSDPDADEWTRHNTGVNNISDATRPDAYVVDITGHDIQLMVYEDQIILKAQLRKFGCAENVLEVRDEVHFKLSYDQSLSFIFREWVEKLDKFINCHCPKWRTKYFLESTTNMCKKKGFELLHKLPPLSKYNFCAGNYFIDIVELQTVNNSVMNNYDWYDADMRKFPRFPLLIRKPEIIDFPMVLSTKVFVEIPAQLANTDRIYQFIDSFDKIKFRKLKNRFNEAVVFHLHPHLRSLIHKEISKRSWRYHHLDHKQRLVLEQQRMSLYMAMLKHKVYPNYFQFKDKFYGHVRNIDFFEFMASKCNEKTRAETAQDAPKMEEQREPEPQGKKARKKCPCPKYVKSML